MDQLRAKNPSFILSNLQSSFVDPPSKVKFMRIQKLPAEAVRKLQSSIIITDAVQCVLELVYNSLDAQATAIAVQIDLKDYKIQVNDNGRGITRVDLEIAGERFMTSKYHAFISSDTFTTYGYKGQAISSLLDVCRSLRIETKTHEDKATFTKIFQGNKALPIIESSKNNGVGTAVTVEDFMCSVPVRRKRIHEIFDLNEIRTQLKYLAIVHHNVSFTLRNENKCLILFQTQCTSSALLCIKNIFGASFTKALKIVNHRGKNYKISGFVSKKPQYQNNVQLLYINKRLIAKGIIHKVVNDVIDNYLRKTIVSSNSSLEEFIILKNSKRILSNAFILKMKCPVSHYELFTNLRNCTVEFRNWKVALRHIKNAIKEAFYVDKSTTNSSSIIVKNNRKNDNAIENKKKHGTSLLVNAVKGVPVERRHETKINEEFKKPKNFRNSSNIVEAVKESDECSLGKNSSTLPKSFRDCTFDSLESPIPKKRHRKNSDFDKASKMINALVHNRSFVQFYEWLKKRIETDSNDFKFYQNFLQRGENLSSGQFVRLKSPVLGEKTLKKSAVDSSDKNLKISKVKNYETITDLQTVDDDNICAESQRIAGKCLCCGESKGGSQRIRKYFFNEEKSKSKFNNILRFNYSSTNNKRRKETSRSTNPPEKLNRSELRNSLKSPSQSELFFSNFIKFRNFTDGFESQPRTETPESNSGTWTSHCGNMYMNLTFDRSSIEKEKLFSLMKNFEFNFQIGNSKGNDAESESRFGAKPASAWHLDFRNDSSKSVGFPKMKDAIVQTEITQANHFSSVATLDGENGENIPNSIQVDEVGDNGGNDFTESRIGQENVGGEIEMENENASVQEIPYPDFWNASKTESLEKEINDTDDRTTPGTKKSPACESQKVSTGPKNLAKNSGGEQSNKAIQDEEVEFSSSTFYLTERHDFVPKGMSPIFSNSAKIHVPSLSPRRKSEIKSTIENVENVALSSVKWQDEISGSIVKPTSMELDGILGEMREKVEKNMIDCESQIRSASVPNRAIKVHDLLNSLAFTKEWLSGVEIIGQLDKKFIVAKMVVPGSQKKELIIVFDQHAVDERIKLEELLSGYTFDDGKFLSARLNHPIKCEVNESMVEVVSKFQNELLHVGFECAVVDEKTLSIQSIPAFLADKHAKHKKNKSDAALDGEIQELITSGLKELTETRGTISRISKILHNLFCSEACHGAIKFNKPLTADEMSRMINKLKNCKLPFQCAHGRPSLIPIIDLEHV